MELVTLVGFVGFVVVILAGITVVSSRITDRRAGSDASGASMSGGDAAARTTPAHRVPERLQEEPSGA